MRWRFLWIVLAVSVAVPSAYAAQDPQQVIERLSDQLLGVMKQGKQLGFRGRFDKLRPAISEAYDMPAMTRAALGPSAAKLTPTDESQLEEAFTRYTVASYAQEFDDWGGEKFVVDKSRPSTGDTVVVPSRIVSKSGTPTEIDYAMHRAADGSWRIIDVLLEGTVSQVAVRRSEFVSIYRRDGLPGLISVLEKKTAAPAP